MTRLRRGNQELHAFIAHSSEMLVGRVGATELSLINGQRGLARTLLAPMRAKVNAGIWPPIPSQLRRFREVYVQSFADASIVAAWGESALVGEADFIRRAAPHARTIPLASLDPVLIAARGETPWSASLTDATVGVISSFAELIDQQFQRRELLFPSGVTVLPKCRLLTMAPPQTQALNVSRRSWSYLFEQAKKEAVRRFVIAEIVLVSSGSYGMPLAAALADEGIKTIYVGGCLQLLFGIRGRRWQDQPEFRPLMTSAWVTPAPRTVPRGARLIEGGAYW